MNESSGRGRPRDRDVDARIRDAARALMADGGYSAVTVAGVAKRAGLPRSTIYRRYPSQFALRYASLVLPADGPVPVPATDDIRADMRRHAGSNAAPFRNPVGRELLRAITLDLLGDDVGRRIVTEEQVLPRLDEVATVIAAARDRGDLPPRCDPMLAATAITGTLVYHVLLLDQEVDDDLLDRLTALLFGP